MIFKYYLCIWLACMAIVAHAQTKRYELITYSPQSDLDYKLLNDFDTFVSNARIMEAVNKPFLPVKGKCKVYRFIATYLGNSVLGHKKTFHDVLVVKTDKNNFIMDAYQYTLEWSEWPLSTDLYRGEGRKRLTDGMDIAALKLIHKDDLTNKPVYLREPAKIYLIAKER